MPLNSSETNESKKAENDISSILLKVSRWVPLNFLNLNMGTETIVHGCE